MWNQVYTTGTEEEDETSEYSHYKLAGKNKSLYVCQRQDVEQMHQAYEIQLAILQKKPVTDPETITRCGNSNGKRYISIEYTPDRFCSC